MDGAELHVHEGGHLLVGVLIGVAEQAKKAAVGGAELGWRGQRRGVLLRIQQVYQLFHTGQGLLRNPRRVSCKEPCATCASGAQGPFVLQETLRGFELQGSQLASGYLRTSVAGHDICNRRT